jgi:hypothetical protein
MLDLVEGLDSYRRLIRERSKDAAVSLFDWVSDTETLDLAGVAELWERALRAEPTRPLSLYVHVPLCRSRCRYCMYPSALHRSAEQVTRYLAQIEGHGARLAPLFRGRSFEKLYVGGGTVTCLSEQELDALFTGLFSRFDIAPQAGRAVEFNPESTSIEKLRVFERHGFNRVSCGIQTFASRLLEQQNRRPAPDDKVRELLAFTREHFASTNVDLMVGLPGQTTEDVVSDITRVVELGVNELHAYFYQNVGTGCEDALIDTKGEAVAAMLKAIPESYQTDLQAVMIHAQLATTPARDHYTFRSNTQGLTLGLGTFATSLLGPHGEYVSKDDSFEATVFHPTYRRVRWLVDAFENDGALSLPETARRFGQDEADRLDRLATDLSADGHVSRGADGLVRVAPGRNTLDVMLALLGDEDVAAVVKGLDWSASLEEAPALLELVTRLFQFERANKAPGARPVRPVAIKVQAEGISVTCRWQDDAPSRADDVDDRSPIAADAEDPSFVTCSLHLTPTRDGGQAFYRGRRVSVSYEGRLPPALLRHLMGAGRKLDAYRFRDLRDRLLQVIRSSATPET